MKYAKYQQDLIKELLSGEPIRGFIGHENKNVLVTMDGFLMVAIPDCLWYLDVQRTREKLKPFEGKLAYLYDEEESKSASRTGLTLVQEKKNLVQIKNEEAEAWVDEKLLRYFENPSFKIRSWSHAVGVYERERFVGIVMPVRKKGEVQDA